MIKWIKSLFTPKPKEIWQQTDKVFLREEEVWTDIGVPDIEHFYVYAIYQTSLTTDKQRIFEKWQLFPDSK